MVNDLNVFGSWFDSCAWPPLPCPSCRWKLPINPVDIKQYESPETAQMGMLCDDWDPTDSYGKFYGVVHCDDEDCNETVILAGVWRYTKESGWPLDPNDWRQGIRTEYHLEYMSPPPRLARLSSKAPEIVKAGIVQAAKLMWIDPSAAMNRLRSSLEVLMDDLGIPRSGRLHDRINSLATINSYTAEILQAVKWAGNQGSHGLQDVTVKDVIETVELMQHALELLYDKADLFHRAQLINQAKRLPTAPAD